MANALQDIVALAVSPIPGESPTGISARYEPEYEAVQAEIEKLQAVSQTPVRWDLVLSNGQALLSQKTKDLLIASYVSAALLAQQKYAGLSAALGFYKDFLSTFWDKLYPPVEKMRGREAAVKWLDERAARMVAEAPDPRPADRDAIQACVAALEAVNAVLSEKFTDSPIGLSELSEKLEEKLASIPAPAAPAPAAEAQGSSNFGSSNFESNFAESPSSNFASGSEAPAPESGSVAVGAFDTAEGARDAVLKVVEFLKAAQAADPLAYALERVLAWSAVTELPDPMPAGGDAALAASWETGLKKKEYQRVLEEAEARLQTDPLWLDPNLVVLRAMEGLGPTYDAARAAIAAEVGGLVRRLPELPFAAFEGDVPTASDVTRQWIAHEVLGGAPGKAASEDRLESTMRDARKLATRGKLPEAIALVQKELHAVPPGRPRFLWRLNLARLCAESGRPNLAVPQLEALDGEAERGALESWEPELAADVVKLLWQCYSSLSKSGGEAMSEKAARSYSRLCRLDLSLAMSLDGKK